MDRDGGEGEKDHIKMPRNSEEKETIIIGHIHY